MISLLLTLFISVFSFCPSINRLEEHNENTITFNENVPINNAVSYDEYGIQFGMFASDFLSSDFIVTFVTAIGGDSGSAYYNLSLGSVSTGSIDLSSNAHIYSCENGYVDLRTPLFTVNVVKLEKLASAENTLGDSVFIYCRYRFSLISSLTTIYSVTFETCTPMYDDYEHELGIGVISVTNTVNNIGIPYFCYYENNLDSDDTPLIAYYYNYKIDKRIQVNNDNYNRGFDYGKSVGYQQGYNQALEDTQAYDTTASTIFNGALEIGLLPVNFFLSIFNFEVFGLNVKSIVSALLTLAVVIIIVRFLFGGKDDK